MPAVNEVATIMIGEKESKKLNTASLPNGTVKRRIVVMSDDILEPIVTHVKESPFISFNWIRGPQPLLSHLPLGKFQK